MMKASGDAPRKVGLGSTISSAEIERRKAVAPGRCPPRVLDTSSTLRYQPRAFSPARQALTQQRPVEDSETIRQIGEMWDAARSEFARLREMAERAVAMSKVQAGLTAVKTDREAALLKLGEAFYKMVEDGQLSPPAALKRMLGEVKAKDAELLRQQADIAAIIKEADALADKHRKLAPKKKPTK